MNTLESRVRDITCTILGLQPSGVSVRSHFVEDLGADSMDCVELLIAFEDAFELELADEVVPNLVTPEAVVRHVSDVLVRGIADPAGDCLSAA